MDVVDFEIEWISGAARRSESAAREREGTAAVEIKYESGVARVTIGATHTQQRPERGD